MAKTSPGKAKLSLVQHFQDCDESARREKITQAVERYLRAALQRQVAGTADEKGH